MRTNLLNASNERGPNSDFGRDHVEVRDSADVEVERQRELSERSRSQDLTRRSPVYLQDGQSTRPGDAQFVPLA